VLNGIDQLISQNVYIVVSLPDGLLFNQFVHPFTSSFDTRYGGASPAAPG
jgi:hypothetical protein